MMEAAQHAIGQPLTEQHMFYLALGGLFLQMMTNVGLYFSKPGHSTQDSTPKKEEG